MNKPRPVICLIVLALTLSACLPPAGEPASTQDPSAPGSAVLVADVEQFADQVAAGPHELVTAADGQAQLLIPPGALPPGKTAGDLSLTPLDPVQLTPPAGDSRPVLAYQLEPDGLRFDAPVLLRLMASAADGSVYHVWHEIDGEVNAQSPALVEFVQASEVITISVAIDHFSQVYVGSSGLVLDLKTPGNVLVGETFEAAIGISPPPQLSPEEGATAVVDPTSDAAPMEYRVYAGTWTSVGLSPAQVNNAPSDDQSSGQIYYREQDFTCLTAGVKTVSYRATVDYRQHYATFNVLRQTLTANAKVTNFIFCRRPEPSPTTPPPTPTPTPTATQTPTPVSTLTATPRQVGCGPDLHDLRQCLDDMVNELVFLDTTPDHRIVDNGDPATLYRNEDVLALLTDEGVVLLHNYYARPVNCPLAAACVLQTLLVELEEIENALDFFEQVAGPGTGMPNETEIPVPNADDWDASKCARGTRPSSTAGAPDFAVLYCSVSEGLLHWGFNLAAYEDLPEGFEEEVLDDIMERAYAYLSVWR